MDVGEIHAFLEILREQAVDLFIGATLTSPLRRLHL
jgi:hypothetical protein